MQINNFYTVPFPSVRNPLDSIVLSPHTIKANDFGLANMEEDCSDYRSILPSICICKYHDQDACSQSKSFLQYMRQIFCRALNGRDHEH